MGRSWADTHSAVLGSGGSLLCSTAGEIWWATEGDEGSKLTNLSAALKAPLCKRGEPCAATVKGKLVMFYCDVDGDLHHLLQGSNCDDWQHHYVKNFVSGVVACRDGQMMLRQDGKAKSAELYYITHKRTVIRVVLTDCRPAKWTAIQNLHQKCASCPMPAQRLKHFVKKGICYEGTDRAEHSLQMGFFNNWSWVIGGLQDQHKKDDSD